MTFTFEVDPTDNRPDAEIPGGTMVRTLLKIVPKEVKVFQEDRKEPGWAWVFSVKDPKWNDRDLMRAGKLKLHWPLSEMGTHYILATACKGDNLTAGEIEGPGPFGNLLDTLVDRFYDVRVVVSDNGKWNNLAWPPTIILSQDQTPELRPGETGFEDDEIPENLTGDADDEDCPL